MHLGLSLASLLIGVAVFRLLKPRGRALALLDGFILAIFGVTIVGLLVPRGLEATGLWGGLALVAGVAIPLGLKRGAHGARSPAIVWTLFASLIGHAFVDGGTLGLASQHDATLGASEVHNALYQRLPVGLVLAWLLPESWSGRRAWLACLGLVFATCAGFLVGPSLLLTLSHEQIGFIELLFAGNLLYILTHPPHFHGLKAVGSNRASALGVLSGAGLMFGASFVLRDLELLDTKPATAGDVHGLTTLALESAPALLLAFIAAGLLRTFWSSGIKQLLSGPSAPVQAFKGMVFGLPLPVCSCGVVPLYEGLIRSGAPLAASLAFLVATPEIGIGALLLSFPLLGMEMTLFRVGAAVIAAFAVALITLRFAAPQVEQTSRPMPQLAPEGNTRTRLVAGMSYGLKDLVDDVMPWVLVGLLIASLLAPVLEVDSFGTLPLALQVPLAAVAGLPIYVCASGSTPLVAVLLAGGLSPGAGIAFLLTGPATNVVTFGVLSRLHGRTAALVFGAAMVALSCAIGWAVDLMPPALGGIAAQSADHHHDHTDWIAIISLVLMGLITLGGLFRLGIRGMLAKVFDHSHHEDDPSGACHGEQDVEPETCCPSKVPTPCASAEPTASSSTGCCG